MAGGAQDVSLEARVASQLAARAVSHLDAPRTAPTVAWRATPQPVGVPAAGVLHPHQTSAPADSPAQCRGPMRAFGWAACLPSWALASAALSAHQGRSGTGSDGAPTRRWLRRLPRAPTHMESSALLRPQCQSASRAPATRDASPPWRCRGYPHLLWAPCFSSACRCTGAVRCAPARTCGRNERKEPGRLHKAAIGRRLCFRQRHSCRWHQWLLPRHR